MKELMISSLENIIIGWYLSIVKYTNAVIFYAAYAMQKYLKAIKGNAYVLREDSLGIYNIIMMILKIRRYDLQI